MGSAFSTWTDIAGPTYMGANTQWEVIWTIVAAVLCVIALISGSRHELDAYRRMKEGKPLDAGPG